MHKARGRKFRRFLAATLLLVAVFGLFLIQDANGPPAPGTEEKPDKVVTVTPDKSTGSSGRVVADDETILSPPKQVTITEPSPTFAKKRPNLSSEEPPTRYVTINNRLYPLRQYRLMALPNDPMANQWWVDNAQFEPAWTTPHGGNGTVLAIIDTGFALNHEEFAGRWHTNSNETGATTAENPSNLNCTDRSLILDASCNLIDDDFDGTVDNETGTAVYENPSRLNCTDQTLALDKSCNRVDDDGNGLIDDVNGWDFINNDNSVQAGELNPAGEGTTHGTMVAGVAAASGNNAKGIAGSDWATKILPIQALDDDSYGDTLSVGRSIFYAIEQGADVINVSLGTTHQDDYVREAIDAATRAGVLVVASSGNDGCECMVYPAAYSEVLAVGALNTSNTYASFSSWGAELDMLAPGTDITSPTWSSSNQTAAYASGLAGTSFASPMVAGMITRMLSHQPTAAPLQLIGGITESVNRLGLTVNTPHSSRYGFGTLHADRAVKRMTTPNNPFQIYSFSPVQKGSFIQPGTNLEAGSSYYPYYCENGTIPTTAIYELKKSGSHFFSISKVETRIATLNGYSSSLFAYSCVRQPHDNPTLIRALNIFREFQNIPEPR